MTRYLVFPLDPLHVLVTVFPDGRMTAATRPSGGGTWEAPVSPIQDVTEPSLCGTCGHGTDVHYLYTSGEDGVLRRPCGICTCTDLVTA